MTRPRVLVIDDDPQLLVAMSRLLSTLDFEPVLARGGRDALERFTELKPDVVLLDYWMSGLSGADTLEALRRLDERVPVILHTGAPTMESVVSMTQRGVFDVLSKPVARPVLRDALLRALATRTGAPTPALRPDKGSEVPEQLVLSGTPAMLDTLKLVGSAIRPGATGHILITGETGTGKTMLARLIHQRSGRAAEPFVTVHCAGVPAELLTNELFGHEVGAYTGAEQRQMGRIEAAAAGTLFLDEIGEVGRALQVKLLRLLDDGEYERLGSTQTRVARCRIVAATNVDVEAAVARGELRADLFHRLSVVRIHMPSLRQRRDDVLPLARFFTQSVARRMNQALSLSVDAEGWLLKHPFPGNIRQLRHIIEHAATVAGQGVIGAEHLSALERVTTTDSYEGMPSPLPQPAPVLVPQVAEAGVASLSVPLVSLNLEAARAAVTAAFERHYLETLLSESQWNVSQAARVGGISRQYLQRMLKKYDIDAEQARVKQR